jgi:hypothetical protein
MPAEAADAERVLLFSTGNVFYLNDTKAGAISFGFCFLLAI